jgi:hypothetical protein
MLSAIGGSTLSTFSPVIAVGAIGFIAILIVRVVYPAHAAGETLSIAVLCVTAVIAYLQWQTLEKTRTTSIRLFAGHCRTASCPGR